MNAMFNSLKGITKNYALHDVFSPWINSSFFEDVGLYCIYSLSSGIVFVSFQLFANWCSLHWEDNETDIMKAMNTLVLDSTVCILSHFCLHSFLLCESVCIISWVSSFRSSLGLPGWLWCSTVTLYLAICMVWLCIGYFSDILFASSQRARWIKEKTWGGVRVSWADCINLDDQQFYIHIQDGGQSSQLGGKLQHFCCAF